jgi:predicted metal-dependent phosphotriesterase family hydrolase
MTPPWRKQRLVDNPHSYLFIDRVVLPRLKEMGVSQEAIQQMMVENPRRFFEGG